MIRKVPGSGMAGLLVKSVFIIAVSLAATAQASCLRHAGNDAAEISSPESALENAATADASESGRAGKVSANGPEDVAAGVAESVSTSVAADMSVGTSADILADILAGASAGASAGMSVGTSAGASTHKISLYDAIMRRVSSREGLDWRLLAAIAYGESRFNPDLVSRMGAKGLMQIMPATAKQFNVPPEYIFNPEVNITLATKLLGKIESMLRLPRGIAFDDRMSIILACYNCGIGHVLDARRLAVKYDADPNSWDDVAHFLSLKADPAYHSDEVVKCGTFRGGGTTTAFVNTVMKKYDAYRTKTEEASPLL